MDVAAWLTERGAAIDDGRVAHLADPDAEARRAWAGEVVLVPLLSTAPLRVRGADRAAFLHGQLSNAVQGLPVGASNHTLQLDARGRVLGEAVLAVRQDDLYLAVEDGRGAAVRASLERHVVFDEVEIHDLSRELTTLTLQGRGAAAVLIAALGEDAVPTEGRSVQAAFGDASVLVVARRRCGAGGFDLHLLSRQLPALVEGLGGHGAELAGERALSLARVRACLPSAARDGGTGALPQELGLDDAVGSGKGCYLGQEIMARIEARGNVRRGLARVALTSPSAEQPGDPPAGDDATRLWLDGREVGRLGQVVRAPDGTWLGMAVVRRDLPPGAVLTAGGWTVRRSVDAAAS